MPRKAGQDKSWNISLRRIYLVGDDNPVRSTLSDRLSRAQFEVFSFKDSADFLNSTKIEPPAVIVINMELTATNGLELQAILMSRGVKSPIIFTSRIENPRPVITAFRRGAADYFLEPYALRELIDAIGTAFLADEKRIRHHQTNEALFRNYKLLTPTEQSVFVALAHGGLVKQIAMDRNVSESAIKKHKSSVMLKFNIRTLQELSRIYTYLKEKIDGPERP